MTALQISSNVIDVVMDMVDQVQGHVSYVEVEVGMGMGMRDVLHVLLMIIIYV